MDGEGDDVSATEAWHAEVAIGREIAAEADRIEAEHHDGPYPFPDVEGALDVCVSAIHNAERALGEPEQHRRLVRLAAWALVAPRAEAREQTAGKGGGT